LVERSQTPLETDALIIGAGPVGLFQVFELGLLGVQAHVVDSLPFAGGQCIALYADKPIYDIPAIKRCTGRELTERLLDQAAPFKPFFHFNQTVDALQRQDDGRYAVQTSAGTRFLAKTVFIAAGVGAFQPRKLHVDGLDAFEGTQVHYQLLPEEAVGKKDVVVLGGEDSALEAAIALCHSPAQSVTLIHRRDVLQAEAVTLSRVKELRASGRLRFVEGQVTGLRGQQRLHGLVVTDKDGQSFTVPLDSLVVFLGLSPKLGPVAQWSLDMERNQLRVDTETFATSAPSIYAVGDINTYPGKKKLTLCGFHEATLAAFAAMQWIAPQERIQLQYTTTSSKLHRALGVTP
jgi:thioredoxin reductase (NADPH)